MNKQGLDFHEWKQFGDLLRKANDEQLKVMLLNIQTHNDNRKLQKSLQQGVMP